MSDTNHTYPGQRIYRYEVPAVILVNASSPEEAHEKALAIGPQLDGGAIKDGPAVGASVAAVEWPRKCEDDRVQESTGEHAESLQAAAGMQ